MTSWKKGEIIYLTFTNKARNTREKTKCVFIRGNENRILVQAKGKLHWITMSDAVVHELDADTAMEELGVEKPKNEVEKAKKTPAKPNQVKKVEAKPKKKEPKPKAKISDTAPVKVSKKDRAIAMHKDGKTKEEAAEAIGCDPTYVSDIYRLLDLVKTKDFKAMSKKDQITRLNKSSRIGKKEVIEMTGCTEEQYLETVAAIKAAKKQK